MAEYDENREQAQRAVYDAVLRNALNIERSNNGITADMNAVIDAASKTLASELLDRLENLNQGELMALSRYQNGQSVKKLPTRVQGIINYVESWSQKLNGDMMATWQQDAPEFAQKQIDFVSGTLTRVVEDLPAAAITGAQVYKQAMETPMLGTFVEQSLSDVAPATRDRVYSTIRQGITNNQTNAEIVRALRGTSAANYKDGVLNTTRNDAQRIVRTARNHVGSIAYDETFRALGVTQVVFVATLDGRTTFQCTDNDGRRFDIDKPYPKPPLHYSCRSTVAPSFGGEIEGSRPFVKAFKPIQRIPKDKRPDGMTGNVHASTSMTDFLMRSDNAAFAKQYFGQKRYDLFKSGKLSVKQMIKADGQRYSLAELESKYSDIWRDVFGS